MSAAGGQLVAGCGPAGAPGALEPLIGKRGVAPDAAAMAIHHAEAVVGLGVTEARRLRVEQGGLLGGAGHAQPIQCRAPQARPRPRVPQLRRTLEGRQRRRRIGLAAQTIQQRLPQTVFGRAVRGGAQTLRLTQPADRRPRIPRPANALQLELRQPAHRLRMTQPRRRLIPLGRPAQVARRPTAILIAHGHPHHRRQMAAPRRLAKRQERPLLRLRAPLTLPVQARLMQPRHLAHRHLLHPAPQSSDLLLPFLS